METIVECRILDPGFLQLSLGPLMTVEVDPDWERRVRVGLPESRAPFRVPNIKVEVIHICHLSRPLHVWMRPFLLTFCSPRPPRPRLFLSAPPTHHSTLSLLPPTS